MALFKFDVKGLSKTIEIINKGLLVANKRVLDQIGEFVVDRIQRVTRSGKTLGFGGKPRKLKALSSSYKAMRRGRVSFFTDLQGRLRAVPGNFAISRIRKGKSFSPTKSNLTLTGQMLDALSFKSKPNEGSIDIILKSRRRKLPGQKQRIDNIKVAEFVENQGRPFIGIDPKGRNKIRDIIIKELKKNFR